MEEKNRPQILVTKIEMLDRYIAVIDRIRMYQEPEESACAALGVNAQTYRKVMDLLPDKMERIPYTAWAKWEDRMLSDICMEPCQAPTDFQYALYDVCLATGYRNAYDILLNYYRDDMNCLEIGEQECCSASCIRGQIDEILRVLRQPQHRAALRYGAQYADSQEYLASGQTEYENILAKTLQDEATFRENTSLAIEDELCRQKKAEEVRQIGQEASDRNDQLRKIDVEEIGFSTRTENALKYNDIDTAYKIATLKKSQFLLLSKIGPVGRREIREKMMEKYGIEMPNV